MENDETGKEWETRGKRWLQFGAAWREQRQVDAHLLTPARVTMARSASTTGTLELIRQRARQLRGATTFLQLPVAPRDTSKAREDVAAAETRGGRDKRLYQLTHAGKKVLAESRELRNDMWKQVPKIVWEGSN